MFATQEISHISGHVRSARRKSSAGVLSGWRFTMLAGEAEGPASTTKRVLSMKMYLHGEWINGREQFEVRSPFDGDLIATVPQATVEDVDRAIAGAVEGAVAMRRLPGYERFQILRRAADAMLVRREELAKTISLEEGKTLAEANFEVGRAAETIELSAE